MNAVEQYQKHRTDPEWCAEWLGLADAALAEETARADKAEAENERLRCGAHERPMRTAGSFYVVLIGPLSDDPVGYLGNVRRFCHIAAELILAGYCPLNPAGDLLEVLVEPRLSLAVVRRRTRQMIELAAAAPRRAALCLGAENARGERSTGVAVELDDCRALGVPVVWSEAELHAMRGTAEVRP